MKMSKNDTRWFASAFFKDRAYKLKSFRPKIGLAAVTLPRIQSATFSHGEGYTVAGVGNLAGDRKFLMTPK